MINKLTSQNRGQVGIGTIIVFIAMVLVAAIAAGVLITTAGELQEQASTTATETEDQVSNLVESEGIIGVSKSTSNKISIVKVTHSLSSGSNPVDISDLTWTVETDGSVETYSYNDVNSADPDGDSIREISDNIKQSTLLVNQEDRIEVEFNLDGKRETGQTATGLSGDDGDLGNGDSTISSGESVTLPTSAIDETDDSERLTQIEEVIADPGGSDTDRTDDFSIIDENVGQIKLDSGSDITTSIDVTFTRTTGGLNGVDSVASDESFTITINSPAGGQRYFGTITPNYIDLSEASYRLK